MRSVSHVHNCMSESLKFNMMPSRMNLQLNSLSEYRAIFILLVFIDVVVISYLVGSLNFQYSNWPLFHRKSLLSICFLE